MDQTHKTKRVLFTPVSLPQGPPCRELLATPVAVSKAGNKITNYSGDSELVKGHFWDTSSVQFSSVQSLSRVRLCPTP